MWKNQKRIFSDHEYKKAGGEVTQNLPDADLIFGVIEMPGDYFEEDKTDFSVSFDDLSLPEPIKNAVIVYRGKVTPG